MRTDLQVAVIGFGLAGRVFHAPLIRHTDGLALHSIVSSREADVRGQFSDVQVRSEPGDVFGDPAIDAVVIATPNDQHAPLAIAALRAGKHVLVDKPFALDAEQAEAVLRAARDSGRVVSVFQNRRFDADFLTLQSLLARGVLGTIAECHSHFDRYRPQVRDRWRERDLPGAGLWYDLGPHLLDQMLQLFGWPQAITADLDRQRGEGSVDYLHAVLHYPRMRAVVHAGSLVSAPAPRFCVHGSAGSWIKHGLDVQESQLAAGLEPGAPDWGRDPEPGMHRWIDDGGRARQADVETVPGDYRRIYAAFAAAITTGVPPEVTADQALQLMQLLDAGQRSALEGRTIPLGPAPVFGR